jgi:hypothetical protein
MTTIGVYFMLMIEIGGGGWGKLSTEDASVIGDGIRPIPAVRGNKRSIYF